MEHNRSVKSSDRRRFLHKSMLTASGAAAASLLPVGLRDALAQAASAERKSTAEAGTEISLAGEWLFRMDPSDEGLKNAWFRMPLRSLFPDRIALPGTTDQAGYGTRTIGATPMVLTRIHRYYGAAWYAREITIPESWNGKTVNLFLERVIFQSRAWIDGREAGTFDSLTTPHVHELGTLTPGKHALVLRIDNRPAQPIGVDGHGYSDFIQTIWNGVIGRIALHSSDPVSIGLVRVFGDAEAKSARVEASLVNRRGMEQTGTLTVAIREKESDKIIGERALSITIPAAGTTVTTTVLLTTPPRLWDEFSTSLHVAELCLTTGNSTDRKNATFGFRTLTADRHHVKINGRSLFIRGNINHGVHPITGYPPMDKDGWRRIFDTYKSYGMNAVRFHSWTPPEAAFEAADETGIYIQAEICWFQYPLGSGLPFGEQPQKGRGDLPPEFSYFTGSPDAFVRAEMRRVADTYGNHPSFAFFVIGNELGRSIWSVTGRWIGEEKAYDPRRLYAASTARTITPEDDFSDTHEVPGVGMVRDRLEAYNDWDYDPLYMQAPVPIIAHELGQWPTYPRWNSLKKFSGVLQPRNLERFEEEARQQGVHELDDAFHLASNALALRLYKDEMESHLRTQACLGYSTLDMVDYPGQGEALVGWLDEFYLPKGRVTPEAFRRWNNSVVVLARIPSYVWSAGERITGSCILAHYGAADFRKVQSGWRLLDRQGGAIASGVFTETSAATGGLTHLSNFAISTEDFQTAAQLTLELFARCDGHDFTNSWSLWVYPAQPPSVPVPASVVVTDSAAEAEAEFFAGKTVLLDAHSVGGETNERIASFLPTYWSASYFPGALTLGAIVRSGSPALQHFPTEDHYDWQWADLCKHGHGFALDCLPPEYQPIVQPVPDFHVNRRYGTIFELRSQAGGRLLVCGYDISSHLEERRTATQLRLSLLQYIQSSAFQPQQLVSISELRAIFS